MTLISEGQTSYAILYATPLSSLQYFSSSIIPSGPSGIRQVPYATRVKNFSDLRQLADVQIKSHLCTRMENRFFLYAPSFEFLVGDVDLFDLGTKSSEITSSPTDRITYTSSPAYNITMVLL